MRQYTETNLVCHDQVGKSVVSVHSDCPQDAQSPDWCYHYLDNSPSEEPPATAERKEEAEKSDHEGELFNIETE